jgi:hypothetical protein
MDRLVSGILLVAAVIAVAPFLVVIIPIFFVYIALSALFSSSSSVNVSSKPVSTRDRQKWDSYGEFLKSEVWKEKRSAVMARAEGCCENEGCGNRAAHVHHLTYRYGWGNTPLALLKALCVECHDAEHPEKPRMSMTVEEATEALDRILSEGDMESDSSNRSNP